MSKLKQDTRPLGSPKSWASTYGTHLAGQAAIDGADHAAIEMEQKWGAGRLRLLVDVAMREKFDKQRFKLNSAIWHGDLQEVQLEAQRMINAWVALDRAAEAAGASKLSPVVWETATREGDVLAFVRTTEEAHAVVREGRKVTVYTIDELATIVSNYREVVKVKEVWPGATVERINRVVSDPLDGIRDGCSLEDTLSDQIPHLGA